MFTCPRCQQRLTRKAKSGISFLVCPNCGGTAIGWSVVRRRLPSPVANNIWQQTRQRQARQGAPCPVCRRHMALVGVPARTGHVFFDICPTCYIAWFDSAEWDALPEQPAQQKERELSPQAREAIALAEVTRIKERDKSAAALPEEPWQWIPAILGLPVELNGPSLRCWPWVTWSLVVLCCAVYAVTFNDVPRFAEGLGFIPEAPFRYGGTTLLTSFFLHVNLLHLIGNMYFLLVFGDNVEDYLGRVRYLAMLMGGNVVGALFHGIGDLRSDVPCIGASAGISAVILFYALQFPNVQLGLFFGFGFWFQWIRFPAYLGAAVWVVLQIVNAYLQVLGVTDVSALAHLGGATVGMLFWLGWRNPKWIDFLLRASSWPRRHQ